MKNSEITIYFSDSPLNDYESVADIKESFTDIAMTFVDKASEGFEPVQAKVNEFLKKHLRNFEEAKQYTLSLGFCFKLEKTDDH